MIGFRTRHEQSGIVLFVALIVLVIMSLVGISMIRQMTSTQVVAGNLAFKEGALAITDWGVERARQLIRSSTTLTSDSNPAGYYASVPWEFGVAGGVPFDMFSDSDWNSKSFEISASGAAAQQNRVRYVVHRLCRDPGPLDTNQCSLKLTTVGGSKSETSYTNPSLPQTQQPYYRVTTRVDGPRNTVSYTQVILY